MAIITAATIRAESRDYGTISLFPGLGQWLSACTIRARGQGKRMVHPKRAELLPSVIKDIDGVDMEGGICVEVRDMMERCAEAGLGSSAISFEEREIGSSSWNYIRIVPEIGDVRIHIPDKDSRERAWGAVREMCSGAGLPVADGLLFGGCELPSFRVCWLDEEKLAMVDGDGDEQARAVESGVPVDDVLI